MDELFLKIENSNIPISEDMVKKYNLKKGMITPYSNYRIADINGDSSLEHKEKKTKITDVEEDEIIYQKSEILG